MTQTLLTTELLATYMQKGVETADQWIWAFERERRAVLRDFKRLTQIVLWLADRPRLAAKILLLVRNSPFLFSHLIDVAGGTRKLLIAGMQPNRIARPAQTPLGIRSENFCTD